MSGITIDRIELRRIELPLVRPFHTAFGTWTFRDVLLARVDATGADGSRVTGWGECAATTDPGYTAEYTAGCDAIAAKYLVPAVFAAGVGSGAEVAGACAAVAGHRMAKAMLEAAVLDAELRAAGVSLAAHLGATRDRVPVGVAVGLLTDLNDLVQTVGAHLDEGYTRVKIKIAPGWDVEPVRRLRAEFGVGFGLQVDANGAYTRADIAHLRHLDPFALLLIEQPFAEDELVDHAVLAAAISTPVCLDESIVSEAVAADAIRLRAASVIAIKPGRVGGHLAGRAIHDRCVAAGVAVWHGGMLETGVGRAANLALAALPGFTLPGDISAADRYWPRDIVTAPATLESDGTIAVPSGPGTGVDVDLDFLASVTTSVQEFHP